MKYEEIQALLDRYWDGETTLEEERRIKAYFNSGHVDERLQSVAALFVALREEQTVQLTSKTKIAPMRPQLYQWAAAASIALLVAAGWWMFREDTPGTLVVLHTPPTEQPQATPDQELKVSPQSLLAVEEKRPANIPANPRKNRPKQHKSNPEIDPETAQAMAEIKAALALVSAKLDKGRNQAIKGASYLETMEKVPKRKEG